MLRNAIFLLKWKFKYHLFELHTSKDEWSEFYNNSNVDFYYDQSNFTYLKIQSETNIYIEDVLYCNTNYRAILVENTNDKPNLGKLFISRCTFINVTHETGAGSVIYIKSCEIVQKQICTINCMNRNFFGAYCFCWGLSGDDYKNFIYDSSINGCYGQNIINMNYGVQVYISSNLSSSSANNDSSVYFFGPSSRAYIYYSTIFNSSTTNNCLIYRLLGQFGLRRSKFIKNNCQNGGVFKFIWAASKFEDCYFDSNICNYFMAYSDSYSQKFLNCSWENNTFRLPNGTEFTYSNGSFEMFSLSFFYYQHCRLHEYQSELPNYFKILKLKRNRKR